MKRRLARGVSVLAVALAAGHLVQTMAGDDQVAQAPQVTPQAIEPVAAGPEAPQAPSQPGKAEAPPVITAALGGNATPPAAAPLLPDTASPPASLLPAMPSPSEGQPAIAAAEGKPGADAAPCPVTLDLLAEENAMIGVTLVAACHPDARVVLRHAGLAVTARTSATGSAFVQLPALETEALVSVLFPDQTTAEATLAMPEVAALRRFGVQWQADDAFQIHAFEGGATYGQPGHRSAADTGFAMGVKAQGGFVTLHGDATAVLPLLAEIYTFPADPAQEPEVLVEAAITPATCGRELLGETITSIGGDVYVTDLTLATPPCDAVDDILVLKNLVPALKLAAAD